MLRKQLTLVASWTFSAMGQWECARFVADRKIPLGHIFTHRFTLDQADEAYRLFDTQTTGKGVFVKLRRGPRRPPPMPPPGFDCAGEAGARSVGSVR